MSIDYKLALKNEVVVEIKNLKKIFNTKKVFVIGYGSLLYSKGWRDRGMINIVKPEHLIECKVRGYKRGIFGKANGMNFYGLIENDKSYFNGVLNTIHTLYDWIMLMQTEMIAGMFKNYNYRVVDVTDKVYGVKLPKNAVVHSVVNDIQNEFSALKVGACPGYYHKVFNGVLTERTTAFTLEFLKTGGLNYNQAAELREAYPMFIYKENS